MPISQRCLVTATFTLMTACTGVVSGDMSGAPRSERAKTNSTNAHFISEGQDFSMRPGDSVALSGHGRLRYLRVVNDSRCKPEVRCIWAGNAELTFEWSVADAGKQSFSLNTAVGDKHHNLGDRRLSLLSVATGDLPEARLRLDATP